jgi:hypothetical protein
VSPRVGDLPQSFLRTSDPQEPDLTVLDSEDRAEDR